MNTKKMVIAIFMSLALVNCAHETPNYQTSPETGISQGDLVKVIDDHIPQFRSCYKTGLESSKNPDKLEGRVVFKFSVNDKGRVTKSEIIPNGFEEDLALRCMKIILDDIQFPIPNKGTTYDVSQAVNFHPVRI